MPFHVEKLNAASRLLVSILLIVLLFSISAGAQEKRALLIGNASYKLGPLKNPTNDVTDMKAALEYSGFKVSVLTNANRRNLDRAIQQFIQSLNKGTTALVFYSGHGAQVEGENFIIPVDFAGADKIDLKYDGYSINRLMEKLDNSGAGVKIVIIDACRNNPFTKGKDSTQGLAAMQSSAGTYLAMATAPGKYASDNSRERNGLYTKYLVQAIKAPGMEIDQVFSQVRTNVNKASSGRQQPWNSSSIVGKFYFNEARASSSEVTRYNQNSSGDLSAFSSYVKGNEAFEAGDYQAAIEFYQAAIGKDETLKLALDSKIELCKEKMSAASETRLGSDRTLILLSEALDKLKNDDTMEGAFLLKSVEQSDPENNIFVTVDSMLKTRALLAMKIFREHLKDKEYEKAFAILLDATERLNPEALYEHGKALYEGNFPGHEKDEKLALKYYSIAAQFGNVKAKTQLGIHSLMSGDYKTAIEHLNVSSTLGDGEAYLFLGTMYARGMGVKPDKSYATSLFAEGAKRGNIEAKLRLAEAYTHGDGIGTDYDKAYYWFLASASEYGGYPPAVKSGLNANPKYSVDDYEDAHDSFLHGYKLFNEGQLKESINSLEYAAIQNHMDACYLLGIVYLTIEEKDRDMAKAKKYFETAAEYGEWNSQYFLGLIYSALPGAQNIFTAKHYFSLAAEQGHDQAAYKLAMIYKKENSKYSLKNSNTWLNRAAEKGNVDAIREIGDMHYSGDGRVKSLEAALSWLELAAMLGDTDAMVKTAVMYESGAGNIKADMTKAVKYYKEAAQGGNEMAKRALRRIRGY